MNQNISYQSFSLDSSAPSLWRVTFNHPPINLIDSVMIGELGELFRDVESRNDLGVIVFDSADPDYFLAHYDITDGNRSKVKSLPAGPWHRFQSRTARAPPARGLRSGCLWRWRTRCRRRVLARGLLRS